MALRKTYYVLLLLLFLFMSNCVLTEHKNENEIINEKLYPFEDFYLLKQYPEKKFHLAAFEKSMQAVRKFSSNSSNRSDGKWDVQGPGNIGARANTFAIDPQNSNNMFVGFSEGGLFSSRNSGDDWVPVFDDQLKLSIGDVVVDPLNSNILYAGTGDPNISGYPFIGDGLYKSVDGGNTWTNIGLMETRVISQIRVSSVDNNIIYVGAMGLPFEKNIHRGVFKSNNGGITWANVLFINDSTGVADIVIHPLNPNIVYAASWNRIRNNRQSLVSGPDAKIFKSTDGGQTWNILTNGLPQDNSSRIGIDISKSNPNVLYACYTDPTNYNLKGIFRSTDGGESWKSLPISESSGLGEGIYGGFGWYFGKIRINPTNPDDVFILAVDLYRSKNGGQNWESASPPWWTYQVHADKHDLIFDKDKMYLTTDGGVYSSDIENTNWIDIENIPTTQFYRVGYNPNEPDKYYGGAQDNGTSGGNLSTIINWERIYGGDGFQCLFHPSNPDLFYVETQNGGIAVTSNGGTSFDDGTAGIDDNDSRNWDMPFLMSQHNPDILYTGTNKVYLNTSGPNISWEAISPDLTDKSSDFLRHNISAIDESPLNSDLIMAGTSDGFLWITENRGGIWKKVSSALPKKYISSVSFSPVQTGTIYVTYTGYKDNDNTPYIYQSRNLGQTWEPIQGNLPRIAINNILVLTPIIPGLNAYIFIATDAGVFYTSDGGTVWNRLGNNMPFITVYDIEYNVKRNQIIAGTFGRSIQSFDLDQIGYTGPVSVQDVISRPLIRLKNNVIPNNLSLELEVENTQNKVVSYAVYGMAGNQLLCGKIENNPCEIEVVNLPCGTYLLVCTDIKNRNQAISKFIKL